MSKINQKSIELPGEFKEGKEFCIKVVSLHSLEVKEACSSEECIKCKGTFKRKINKNKIVLPYAICKLMGIKENMEYYLNYLNNKNSYIVDIKEDICNLCSKKRSNAIRLTPVLDRYICEECYERARNYRLIVGA